MLSFRCGEPKGAGLEERHIRRGLSVRKAMQREHIILLSPHLHPSRVQKSGVLHAPPGAPRAASARTWTSDMLRRAHGSLLALGRATGDASARLGSLAAAERAVRLKCTEQPLFADFEIKEILLEFYKSYLIGDQKSK